MRKLGAGLLAILLGIVIAVGGSAIWSVLLAVNLSTNASVPWSALVMCFILFGGWFYLSGWGPPSGTRESRARSMPQNAKSVVIRISAFFAGLGVSGLALCALLIVLRLGQARFADLPDEATGSPGIALAYFGAASLTAAMVEEAAFRGYMFSGLRRAWGGSAAFLVVALLFSASHAGNPASLQLLPLYFLLSLGLTAVVALSGSLWPGVVAHALADFASYLLLLFWGREALTAPLDLGPPDEALVAIVLTALITTALSVFGFLALVRMRRRNLARRD